MEKLEDIVLKRGDIVCYINACGERSILGIDGYDGYSLKEFERGGWVTIEVKRPTQYKTIYEAPKQILDKEEKKYLENVIRPFKDRVNYIKIQRKQQIIAFMIINVDIFCNDYESESIFLPEYRLGTMYKNMEIDKRYTLKELGLFE